MSLKAHIVALHPSLFAELELSMKENVLLNDIVAAAVAIESPEERNEYLDQTCRGKSELRANVDELVAKHFQSRASAKKPEPAVNETTDLTAPASDVEKSIGPYKLLQQIGEGGMGAVWMAQQDAPIQRMVALKLIKAGMDSKQVIARFEAERQALALMSHPNVAKVFDAGTTDGGRPYFVMELVKGAPITEFCDRKQLSPEQRLKLLLDVCHAVQHAHQKGIIHRDIKPTNVLVSETDGVPVVKVIDFGLAKATAQKLTEKTLFTALGQMVGTPLYMSPEQAELDGLDVDTRTDVYSLGVLLYELMTGTTPIDGATIRKAGMRELQRMIQEQVPPRMSTRLSSLGDSSADVARQRRSDVRRLAHTLRGDLDVIVSKSLEKERSRRYGSPSEFADDLQRYLKGEAIEARPASIAYRAKKFVQRNRLAVLSAASVTMIVVVAACFSTVQAVRATNAARALGVEQKKTLEALGIAEAAEAEQRELRKTAEERKVEADRMSAKLLKANEELAHNLYVSKIFQATAQLGLGDHAKAQDVLASIPPELHNWETRYLSQVAHGTPLTITVSGDLIRAPRFSPDGKWIVAGSDKGVVRFWEADSGEERKAFQIHEAGYFGDLAISPSGDRIASFAAGEVKVWDARTGQVQLTLPTVGRVAFSPDGARLITSGENGDGTGKIKVWNVRDGELLTSIEREFCWRAVFSPDGKSLVAGSGEGEIGHTRLTVWDSATGEERLSVEAGPLVYSVSWSPDGNTIASGGARGSIKLWDAQSGELKHSIEAHLRGAVTSLDFSPDAKWLVSGGDDKTIKIWKAETGRLNQTLKGHRQKVEPVSFSPDGSRIVSGSSVVPGRSEETTAKVWELVTRKRPRVITAHEGEWVRALNFDADATRIVSGGSDHLVQIWDVVTGNLMRSLQGHEGWVNDVCFAQDGTSVFSCSVDGSIRVWTLDPGTSKETLDLGAPVNCIGLNPDGTKLASGSDAGTVVVWDTENWDRILTLNHAPHVHSLAWESGWGLVGQRESRGPRQHRLAEDMGRVNRSGTCFRSYAHLPSEPLGVQSRRKLHRRLWSRIEFQDLGR